MTDVHSCSYYCDRPECIKAQRDELRERLAQPEQGPVAWAGVDFDIKTTPPQRKPLTDEEIDALVIDKDGLPNSHLEFARAIEAAHGIKENRND